MSIPEDAIVWMASGCTSIPGLIPAEWTMSVLSNDCSQPCAIGLRLLLSEQRINIFMFLFSILQTKVINVRFWIKSFTFSVNWFNLSYERSCLYYTPPIVVGDLWGNCIMNEKKAWYRQEERLLSVVYIERFAIYWLSAINKLIINIMINLLVLNFL